MGDIVVSEEYLRKMICGHCAMSHRERKILGNALDLDVPCNVANVASGYIKCSYLNNCVSKLRDEPVAVQISRRSYVHALGCTEKDQTLQDVLDNMILRLDNHGSENLDGD